MGGQFVHPVIKTRHIPHQSVNFGLNQSCRLMHTRIAQDRPHRMQQQHQIIRPRHIDMRAAAGLNQFWQLQIDLSIYGFRRQKQNRAFGGFPRNNIFFGNIGDVFFYIAFHHAARRFSTGFICCLGHTAIGFEREFRINAN